VTDCEVCAAVFYNDKLMDKHNTSYMLDVLQCVILVYRKCTGFTIVRSIKNESSCYLVQQLISTRINQEREIRFVRPLTAHFLTDKWHYRRADVQTVQCRRRLVAHSGVCIGPIEFVVSRLVSTAIGISIRIVGFRVTNTFEPRAAPLPTTPQRCRTH